MQRTAYPFTVKNNIKFAQSFLNGISTSQQTEFGGTDQDIHGGIIRNGQLGWIAAGPHIQVFSIKTGNKISSYTFDSALFSNTIVTCVTEVEIPELNTCILAIGVQCNPSGGLLCLFAVQGSKLLRCIEIIDKITSCSFISASACIKSDLNFFDGCVAVGTDLGNVLLIDLCLKNCKDVLFGKKILGNTLQVYPSHIIISNMSFDEMKQHQKQAKHEDINFGIQLEVLSHAGPVLSILTLIPLLSIAVGFEDGRMVLYDLCDLQAYHMAHPPEKDSPLIKLAYIEPADDPRACVYLWAFHTNSETAIAVMHSVMFANKVLSDNIYIYDNFQACSLRLTMPIFECETFPVSCQSVSKFITDDEDVLSLCLLSWSSPSSSHVCIFDLNQWYKEQMPSVCDWRQHPSYLAVFPLEKNVPLDIWMDQNSVTPFNSIQRPEEHFYPSSLNFDCTVMASTCCSKLHWPGLQNQALELLSSSGPNAILEPNRCFAEMLRSSLMPQLSDFNYNPNQSTKMKQDFLLSMALEYNCVGLLKECAKCWADGSHLGRQPFEGLSLSTLTDWLWNRATVIKERCNNLCVSLFDHSGCTIDLRSRKNLSHCSRQLKLLSDLLDMIISTCQQFIPNNVLDTLNTQKNSIRMASEYQEILQWLLNMGLLPEGTWNSDSHIPTYRDSSFENNNSVPYPYRILRNYYLSQRQKFYEMNQNLIAPKTKGCKMLYIDAFIENECNPAVLRSEWKQGFGDGLYPPPSLQSMLRTLLVPGVPIENKYMLFVYLFLDLNMAIFRYDDRYAGVVKNLIKFPAVFKLDPALIKATQAFWNLDHGEFETAIEELISPISQDRHVYQWQQELLIEALLVQDVPHLALRALRAPRPPISPFLEIKTLLANNLVSEAFQLQRAKCDKNLLLEFFKGCHEHNKWSFVLDLALTREEEQCLGEFLRTSNSFLGENLHFLYLLQRSKYIEAIAFIDDLQQRKNTRRLDLETTSTILSAYNLTMSPTTRHLSDLYYSLKDNINSKLNKKLLMPIPLSSKLLQSKLDLIGGVYHRSVLSTEQTTSTYWHNLKKKVCNLTANNVPFLRNPQYDMMESQVPNSSICYPEEFVRNKKRRVNDIHDDDDRQKESELPRKRQRLGSANNAEQLFLSKRITGVNSSLLYSFKEKVNTTLSLQNIDTKHNLQENECDLPNTILTTPLIKSSRHNSSKHSPTQSRVCTPQSILKVKHLLRESSVPSIICNRSISPPLSSSRKSLEPDEKSIRFNLPQTPVVTPSKTEAELFATSTNMNQKNSIDGTMTEAAHISNLSLLSNSSEEFYSPNVSIDNNTIDTEIKSYLDDHKIIKPFAKTPDKSENLNLPYSLRMSPLQRRLNIADGPKARKRLRSTTPEITNETVSDDVVRKTSLKEKSKSRSKTPENISNKFDFQRTTRSRSKTPDITLSSQKPITNQLTDNQTIRRSNRSRSKTPEIQTVQRSIDSELKSHHDINIKSSTPVKRKPLSRLVLEANAKKITADIAETNTVKRSTCTNKDDEIINIDVSLLKEKYYDDKSHNSFDNDNRDNVSDISSIVSQRRILVDNSEVSDSFMINWNAQLDTTPSEISFIHEKNFLTDSGPASVEFDINVQNKSNYDISEFSVEHVADLQEENSIESDNLKVAEESQEEEKDDDIMRQNESNDEYIDQTESSGNDDDDSIENNDYIDMDNSEQEEINDDEDFGSNETSSNEQEIFENTGSSNSNLVINNEEEQPQYDSEQSNNSLVDLDEDTDDSSEDKGMSSEDKGMSSEEGTDGEDNELNAQYEDRATDSNSDEEKVDNDGKALQDSETSTQNENENQDEIIHILSSSDDDEASNSPVKSTEKQEFSIEVETETNSCESKDDIYQDLEAADLSSLVYGDLNESSQSDLFKKKHNMNEGFLFEGKNREENSQLKIQAKLSDVTKSSDILEKDFSIDEAKTKLIVFENSSSILESETLIISNSNNNEISVSEILQFDDEESDNLNKACYFTDTTVRSVDKSINESNKIVHMVSSLEEIPATNENTLVEINRDNTENVIEGETIIVEQESDILNKACHFKDTIKTIDDESINEDKSSDISFLTASEADQSKNTQDEDNKSSNTQNAIVVVSSDNESIKEYNKQFTIKSVEKDDLNILALSEENTEQIALNLKNISESSIESKANLQIMDEAIDSQAVEQNSKDNKNVFASVLADVTSVEPNVAENDIIVADHKIEVSTLDVTDPQNLNIQCKFDSNDDILTLKSIKKTLPEKNIAINKINEKCNINVPTTSRITRARSNSIDIELISPSSLRTRSNSLNNISLRNTRANSVSSCDTKPNIYDSPSISRETRGKSMPKISMYNQKKQTFSPTAELTPTRRSILLKNMDETLKQETQLKTHKTPRKKFNSESSITSITTSTPRHTRSSSVLVDSTPKGRNIIKEFELHDTKDEKISSRKETSKIDENDDAESIISAKTTKSTKSTKSYKDDDRSSVKSRKYNATRAKRKVRPISNEENLDADKGIDSEYATSRRLTRNQSAILNKIQQRTSENKLNPSKQRRATSRQSDIKSDEEISDTETIDSKKSKVSNLSKSKYPQRQSARNKNKKDIDDSASVASSGRAKSVASLNSSNESAKPKNRLPTIKEDVVELHEDTIADVPAKRSRARKASTSSRK